MILLPTLCTEFWTDLVMHLMHRGIPRKTRTPAPTNDRVQPQNGGSIRLLATTPTDLTPISIAIYRREANYVLV